MKHFKNAGLILAGLMLYGFGAGGTYQFHESRWPGEHFICNYDDDGCLNGSTIVALFWPIGFPVTVGVIMAEKALPTE